MRGTDFTDWLSDSSRTDSGWASQGVSVSSPIPVFDATLSAADWQNTVRDALVFDGAERVQGSVVYAWREMGTQWGMPQGRWLQGARDLWGQRPDLGVDLSGIATAFAATTDQGLVSGEKLAISQWVDALRGQGELVNGLGQAAVRWVMDSDRVQSMLTTAGDRARSVPWVNIVVAIVRYVKIWVRMGRQQYDARNDLRDFGTDFNGPGLRPLSNWDRDLDQQQGDRIVAAIRAGGGELSQVFAPPSINVAAELRDATDRSTAAFMPGWSVGAVVDPGWRGLGCVPGSTAIVRQYDAFAPVFIPPGPADPAQCAPYWSGGLEWHSTGGYYPAAQSLAATAWQACMAESAMMGAIDTGRLVRQWQLFCHHLAREILNPLAWAQNPVDYTPGGSQIAWAGPPGGQVCDFTVTLEGLWNTAAADLGWPTLRDTMWASGDRSAPRPGSYTGEHIARWAMESAAAFGPRNYNPNDTGGYVRNTIADLIGLECTPVQALLALERRQDRTIRGEGGAPILLPYMAPGNPATLEGQGRVDALRDLLGSPAICAVDPDDVPILGGFDDAVELREAIVVARARELCKLNPRLRGTRQFGLTYEPPPALVPGGLGLAGGPVGDSSPGDGPGAGDTGGAALAAVAAAAAYFLSR